MQPLFFRAEHYLLGAAAALADTSPGGRAGGAEEGGEGLNPARREVGVWGRIGSMFARGAVLLLRTCQPDSAARAAVAALVLRRRARLAGGIHDRAHVLPQEEKEACCDDLAAVGALEPYAGFEDAEDDDAVFDSALRLLQRVQGPTCAAAVRDVCDAESHVEHGDVHRQARSRHARALAACLVWFYREERGPLEPGLD